MAFLLLALMGLLLIGGAAWHDIKAWRARREPAGLRRVRRVFVALLSLIAGILLVTGAFFWLFAGYAALFGSVTMTWGAV